MDIIFFALARWDGPYSSTAYSLAKEFSKNHRVFYIDNPITIKYFLANFNSPQIKSRRRHLLSFKTQFRRLDFPDGELIAVTPRLTLPINFLPKGFLYDFLTRVNDAIVFSSLRELLRKFDVKNYLFINCFNPFYLTRFPEYFRPILSAYISVDDIRYSLHISKHGERMENAAVKMADVTLTTSVELKRLKGKVSPNVFHLPNAADVNLFKTSHEDLPRPAEFEQINKPVVIYTGHIDLRLDYELLLHVIESSPEYVFLFVGPVSIGENDLNALKQFSNVVFAGRKDIKELPAYLKYSSCAIIPFKCNDLMKSIYPLKVNEYLAAGKPVVSTPFSDDIGQFSKVVTLTQDALEFAMAIKQSVISDSSEKVEERLNFVESNTWESRVALFWETVKPFIRQ
jgi:teichuronic acid biosynthesis glycosyltransferase TuaH